MSLKITAKILLILTSIEIITLFTALIPLARTENISPSPNISKESANNATDLSNQGQAKAEQQDYRGAIADISRAIQLNPNEADFYYQRGLILAKLEDQEGALKDFDDAILRNPNHGWAYFHRAGVAFGLSSNTGLIYSRSRYYRSLPSRRINSRALTSRAMLDLQTARDLFAQQGDQEGYQKADSLIKYFSRSLENKTSSSFETGSTI